jgi:D-amino-acid dehydrogenase
MAKAIVVGGGIIGLSSAYYLNASGWEVTVIDRGDLNTGCSFGNAGYICPSHFVPLTTPDNVRAGLKWMFNPQSPFYIQPKLNWALLDWGWKFMRNATQSHVNAAAVPLRDIALLSMACYEDWLRLPDFDFYYEKKGMLEIFQTPAMVHHAEDTVKKAQDLGLETELLSFEALQALEPQVRMNALGAIWFKCDAHCAPYDLMDKLKKHLLNNGAQFKSNEDVLGFSTQKETIKQVQTNKTVHEGDLVVIATGSWSRELAQQLDINLPMMPGRGYSMTVTDPQYRFEHPIILSEGRVAVTPLDGATRFGGTMEITDTKTPPRMQRVKGIIASVKQFFPEFDLPMPKPEDVWYGYRPCSADGLPYIGRSKQYDNLIIATGHSMLGLSLGAGTGKLVGEIANDQATSMSIAPFAVERLD